MPSGLEQTDDVALVKVIGNIKTGIFNVFQMPEEELYKTNGHDCPPGEWAVTCLMILQGFRREAEKRGLDYDNIPPVITEYEDEWLKNRKEWDRD